MYLKITPFSLFLMPCSAILATAANCMTSRKTKQKRGVSSKEASFSLELWRCNWSFSLSFFLKHTLWEPGLKCCCCQPQCGGWRLLSGHDCESEITEHRLNEEQKKKDFHVMFQSLHILIHLHRHQIYESRCTRLHGCFSFCCFS